MISLSQIGQLSGGQLSGGQLGGGRMNGSQGANLTSRALGSSGYLAGGSFLRASGPLSGDLKLCSKRHQGR